MHSMATALIRKPRPPKGPPPNLGDDAASRARFSWAGARAALDGLPGGGLNIAHEAVDRHAAGARARAGGAALAWARTGARRELHLRASWPGSPAASPTCSASLGVGPGERVFALCRAHPRAVRGGAGHAQARRGLLPALLGLRPRAHPHAARASATARVLVTTPSLYRRKVARAARGAAGARARAAGARTPGERAAARAPCDLARAAGRRRARDFESRPHPPRGPGAAALHQRHHRHAQGGAARARGGGGAPRHRRGSRSTCTPTTSSGAPPTRAG